LHHPKPTSFASTKTSFASTPNKLLLLQPKTLFASTKNSFRLKKIASTKKLFCINQKNLFCVKKNLFASTKKKMFLILVPLLVGVEPDLGEADGGVEAVVDVEGDTHVEDDVPGQDAVEAQVERHHHGLADLEEGHDPQRQVADQQEGHHCSAGLALHLPRTDILMDNAITQVFNTVRQSITTYTQVIIWARLAQVVSALGHLSKGHWFETQIGQ
jgi:hypothetical protein